MVQTKALMPETFKCPSCSAPLDFEGSTIQKCVFCGSSVIVPGEVFQRPNAQDVITIDLSAFTGKARKAAEIQRLIRAGKKIEAIKLYRETFGVGLKEAKDAVDKMQHGEGVDLSSAKGWNIPAAPTEITHGIRNFLLVIAGLIIVFGGFTFLAIFLAGKISDDPISALSSATMTEASEKNTVNTMLKLGGEGTGAGKFKDNRTVAVDGDGNIYSGNYEGGKIQVFDKNGKFLREIFSDKSGYIKSLAASRSGVIYVVNSDGIFAFNGKTGTALRQIKKNRIESVALTPDGKIAALVEDDIFIFDDNFREISKIKKANELASAAFGFDAITVGGGGEIYAVDQKTGDLCKFSSEGKFLNRIPTGLRRPQGIAINSSGTIFLSDVSAIHAIDETGKELLKFRPPDLETAQAFGITFDVDGALYVASRPFVMKYEFVKK